MAIIKSPNEQYTGVSASVLFVNGEAKTDDLKLIEWFKSKGYTVEEEPFEDIRNESEKLVLGVEQEANQDFTELTNDELKALLDEKGIEYKAKDNKDTLIELLGKE